MYRTLLQNRTVYSIETTPFAENFEYGWPNQFKIHSYTSQGRAGRGERARRPSALGFGFRTDGQTDRPCVRGKDRDNIPPYMTKPKDQVWNTSATAPGSSTISHKRWMSVITVITLMGSNCAQLYLQVTQQRGAGRCIRPLTRCDIGHI